VRLLFFIIIFHTVSFEAFSQISIIGTASPSGSWSTDHDLTESSPGVWTGTYELGVGALKFRLDHDNIFIDHSWKINKSVKIDKHHII